MSRFIPSISELAYIVASVLFILGLKCLSSPTTARKGNILGALGMMIAVLVTLLNQQIIGYKLIVLGLVIGSAIGIVVARMVKMTAMPQMVAVFNGLGGGASALVAADEYLRLADKSPDVSVTIMISILIGCVTFSGSMIAFGKLQEIVTSRPVTYLFQNVSNMILLGGLIILGGFLALTSLNPVLFYILVFLSLALGILLVIPIGGADMPVVIALLNSYSGLAASSTGFVLHNNMLIVAGALVGASGLILTKIMCKAMNRSLANVMFGAFGSAPKGTGAVVGADGTVRYISADDAGVLLAYSKSVVIVPGYGMAVAQAQHVVRELSTILEAKGVDVKYAIHPVAGRMPGHMNVLLAEADVSYDKLFEMDRINPEFDRTDVALVIGANDVTNPAARTDKSSPLYGMPILDVDKAKYIIVLKRSMRPGFAGVDNELYFNEKNRMLFGDAKASVNKLIASVKAS